MSRKTRRTRKQKLRRPGPSPYTSPGGWTPEEPADTGGTQAAPSAPSGGVPAYAAAITGPRRQSASTAIATGNIDIDARVPYFTRDLTRIVITAAVMIAAIVAISYVVR